MTERVLMIEDDEQLSGMLGEYLAGRGFQLVARPDAAQGLLELERGEFDALILDVMLPDLDGFEVCRRVRGGSDIPILMLTARGDETDRIVGLEIGADDYLPKPFNPRELVARLRAILRRRKTPAEKRRVLRFGALEIDREARIIRLDDEARHVTSHQFDILVTLAENAGRVMTRDQLMNRIRGGGVEPFDRSIDVHISRIRNAIEDEPTKPQRIITVRGVGYVFAKPRQSDEVS